jgi:ribosomal protein S18 acetylase RimI-like enzyme
MTRNATLADIPAVLALWDGARSTHAETPDTPEALERLLRTDPGALLVHEDEGEVVGALIAAFDGWRGNMYRLAVLVSHRRRGVARALVEAGHGFLRACGARRVTAIVGAGEEEAEGLWLALGYSLDSTVNRFVRNL